MKIRSSHQKRSLRYNAQFVKDNDIEYIDLRNRM